MTKRFVIYVKRPKPNEPYIHSTTVHIEGCPYAREPDGDKWIGYFNEFLSANSYAHQLISMPYSVAEAKWCGHCHPERD